MKTTLPTITAILAVAANVSQAVQPPPNAPAEMAWDAGKGKLVLRYHGKVILDATFTTVIGIGFSSARGTAGPASNPHGSARKRSVLRGRAVPPRPPLQACTGRQQAKRESKRLN